MSFAHPSTHRSMSRALASCAWVGLVGSLAAQDDSSAANLSAWEAMNARVMSLYEGGRYPEATLEAEEALDFARRELGEEHPRTLQSLSNLAGLYHAQGRPEAEPRLRECLELQTRVLGEEDYLTLATMNNLAALQAQAGKFADAEILRKRCHEIATRVLGDQDALTLSNLNNLAWLLHQTGRFDEAAPLYEKTLEVQRRVLGAENPHTLATMENLALLRARMDRIAQSDALFEEILAIRSRAFGPDHPETLGTLCTLARLRHEQGKSAQAASLYERAVDGRIRSMGRDHLEVLATMDALSRVYEALGRYLESEPWAKECAEGRARVLGEEDARTLESRNHLVTIYLALGRGRDAEPICRRTLELRTRTLGPDHVDTLQSLANLANVANSLGRYACPLLTLAAGPDGDSRSASLALEVTLWHKGILGRVSARLERLSRLAGSRDPDALRLVAELDQSRRELGRLWLAGPSSGETWSEQGNAIARVREVRDLLEAQIAQRLGRELGKESVGAATLRALAESLEPDEAFVDFSLYHHKVFDRGPQRDVERCAALLVRGGDAPLVRAIDLGEAAEIASVIEKFRRVVRDPAGIANPLFASRARELHARLWEPLAVTLEGARRVYLSPDGAIHLVPFETLRTPEGRFLVEELDLVRVPGGLDLIDSNRDAAGSGALVVADPDFGGRDSSAGFARLPGAASEGEAIAGVLSERELEPAQRLTGPDASETELRRRCQARSPAILHLATHGFFLELAGAEALVRSGVALAGANDPPGADGDDGKLTALEALGLPLDGTDLVVLSACDTGVGEVTSGEGVGSLAAAFRHAGARQALLTLWPVADDSTREFMIAFYRRYLQAGDARAALRETQLEFLASDDPSRAAPATWGGFALVGGK